MLAKTGFSAQMSLPVQQAEYGPWGQTLSMSTLEAPDHQFVGFEPDPATGWYFMGARVYDPTLRRWLSPDPLMWAAPESGSAAGDQLNLYSYVGNNPTGRTDPTGFCYCQFGSQSDTDTHIDITADEVRNFVSGFVTGTFAWMGDNPVNEGGPKKKSLGEEAVDIGLFAITAGSLLRGVLKGAAASEGAVAGELGTTENGFESTAKTAWKKALDSDDFRLAKLGKPGKSRGVRELVGDAEDAQGVFNKLRGTNEVREVKEGVFVAKAEERGHVTFRKTSKSGPPTVDVHGIEEGVRKLKFVEPKK